MPEVSQVFFSHKEILELMVKKAGLHEGKWMLMVSFNFAAANFGPSPEEMVPGGIVAVNSIGLQKAPPEAPPSLVIDAAEVNPA
ncbi:MULTISPECIES: hypothetical protein [Bradyrhizobium]|uniref:hypothetical protein n=1 Tax=Bradyrhizobium elkanii TaxID=29448 RepID=UPI0004865D09|nr:hypothetical protein [Bradyrhizobium elkanii]